MTQLVIENIDSTIIEKLTIRAQRHGKTLEAELKAILEVAAQEFDRETVKTAAVLSNTNHGIGSKMPL